MQITPIYTNFTAGELTPLLAARVDFAKYHNGCETLENFVVDPRGGAIKRPGTRYVATTKDSSKASRLIPFEFSTTQAYILEWGDQYLRVYKDGGQVVSGTPSAAYEIATPYVEADLAGLKYCQSADVMYLAHPSYEPRKLSRTGHTSWTLATVSFTASPFTGAGDYPSCVQFFESRLCWAATTNNPQRLWMSVSGDFEDLTTGTSASHAIDVTLAADQVNAIRWMSSGQILAVGTTGGEWRVGAPDKVDPITPSNAYALRETTYGCADVQPYRVGHSVLFLQRAGRRIRELAYNWEVGGYVAPDMTLLAEHVTFGGIVDLAYQQEPMSILWAVRSDGMLLGLTYLRAEDVIAWHRHPMGTAEVESIAAIPGDGYDELWLIVKRTVNGAVSRYVERLDPYFDSDDTSEAYFLDSALTYTGATATTVSGLEHLEGETVSVLANGAVHGNCTVASGAITLDRSASTVHVGLAYTSTLTTMRLEAETKAGTIQGKIKRIREIVLRLYRSLGGKAGPTAALADTIIYRTPGDLMDSAPPLYSGDKEIPYDGGFDTDGQVTIVHDQPLPFTVLGLMPKMYAAEK